MMSFQMSRAARNDLEEIWQYSFEEWSLEQADRYVRLIMNEIEHLCYSPYSGIDYGSLRKGYFKSRVKSHFIFYKINKEQAQIKIIRILHQRMDIEHRLQE